MHILDMGLDEILPPTPYQLIFPQILQLSPLLGNILYFDCFVYNSAAEVTGGDFGAILTFAVAHGHPVGIHECPNLQKFHGTHPSAIVHPLSEIPSHILEQGCYLLSTGGVISPEQALDLSAGPVAIGVITAPLAGPDAIRDIKG
jgi:hypothetical protein